MKTDFFRDKVAVITGSSMGIGKATAISLGHAGAKVIINARNQDRLRMVKQEMRASGIEVTAIAGDVTDFSFCEALVEQVMANYGRLDILINNVGISSRGEFQELSPEVFREVMDTNYLGAVYPSKAALPALLEHQGSLMFISSLAGIRGIQGISAYCAAKMSLSAIADALRIELSDKGVYVGITHVGYTQNSPEKRIYGPSGKLIPLSERKNNSAKAPEEVAKIVLNNLKRQKAISIPDFLGKVNRLLHALTPRLVDRILIRANRKVKRMSN